MKVPAFKDKLYVGRPNIGSREVMLTRFNDMLDSRWLSNDGPFVAEFEKKLAEYLNVKHCITMCNGTVAMEIAIRALGLGGEVIIPSFTFVATAHALQWQEITPVFCDIEPESHTIDPYKVEQLITPRTTGLIGVHVWGKPCQVEALGRIAKKHNLKLLFDAAHAFACSHHGRMIGNFGNVEVFSFHATKFFNTFEGGAVATNDDVLAAKIRLMKNFGFNDYDSVIYIGTNGKMPEVCAAMGLTNLECIDEFMAHNRRNYEHYKQYLVNVPGIKVLSYDEKERRNYQYIVLEIDEDKAGISRDRLLEILHSENVIARRYFYPGCHRMEPYKSYFPHAGLLLPETESLVQRIMLLPTGTAISENDIKGIVSIISKSVSTA